MSEEIRKQMIYLASVDVLRRMLQSGIVDPLESVFVPGRILVTSCEQNEGSIKTPPSPYTHREFRALPKGERLSLLFRSMRSYKQRKHRPQPRSLRRKD